MQSHPSWNEFGVIPGLMVMLLSITMVVDSITTLRIVMGVVCGLAIAIAAMRMLLASRRR